jgi:cyanophycinase-like exopeptidase
MSSKKGVIALMGSGELTSTMVEVHKELLAAQGDSPRAVFLDTPAGFQLNVDQISQKAVEYFRTHVKQEMSIASFKSREGSTPYEAEQAFHALRQADFVLIGPGSPSYAVRQWLETPIPEILARRVEEGACLVAASAAALTVGRSALPVYEIYKVGEELHWVDGIDILGRFGFNLVVIPHWNNAEGGTHDTRFCYMGEPRFSRLESLLPQDSSLLGLDEHTACLIDISRDEAVIKGIGRVILRGRGGETIFERGDRLPCDILREGGFGKGWGRDTPDRMDSAAPARTKGASFWEIVHGIEAVFQEGLDKDEPGETIKALLELDRAIWKAQEDLESTEFISQAREILREMIVSLGVRLEASSAGPADGLAPLVEEFLGLRERFRQARQWQEADEIRESLQRAGVVVYDTEAGPRWRLGS